MKPGLSLHRTTLLPSATSANSATAATVSGAVFGPGDDLQQPHIARRIEEMRDQEVAAERLAHALGQHVQARWSRCWS